MTKPNNSGLVFIDKPAGITSHDVVGQLRRKFHTRRVGHGGTLDPMATGLLILGVESGTKILQFVTDAPKSYTATVRLGQSTNTDDADGEILTQDSAAHLTDAEITQAFNSQLGEINQVPSRVSAIKVNGQRAYARARAGEDFELAARTIVVQKIEILQIVRHLEFVDVQISVDCSKGTYIRAIARDVGNLLAVGGHLTALRRTAIGGVTIAEAHTIAAAEMTSLENSVGRFMPVFEVSSPVLPLIKVGRNLPYPDSIAVDVEAFALTHAESGVVAIAKPMQLRDEIMIGYHSVLITEI